MRDLHEIRFGVVGGGIAVEHVPAWAAEAEALGFDLVGFGDSPALWPDVWSLLTLAASATSHVRLATTVTNLVTRHLGVVAGVAATVQRVAAGRLTVGLGVGDSGVLNLGVRPSRLAHFERGITALRVLLSGRDVELDGELIRSRWSSANVPLMVAAAGPRTLELAGRVADGVILSAGLHDVDRVGAVAAVERGRVSGTTAGRADFETWLQVRYTVADSREEAIDEVRSMAAATGHHVLHGDLDAKHVPAHLQRAVRELGARYDPAHHCAPGDSPNARLVEELGLTEYLVDRFTIAGTPDQCAARVRQITAGGVANLLMATTVEPVRNMQRWGREVVPLLRGPTPSRI